MGQSLDIDKPVQATGGERDFDTGLPWERRIWKYFQEEVQRRIWESRTAIQWGEIAQQHRVAATDGSPRMAEKEFLLTRVNQVDTNPRDCGEDNPWIGREVIVKVDRQYHRPRLRFCYAEWHTSAPLEGGQAPPHPPLPASGRDLNTPAFMVGAPS